MDSYLSTTSVKFLNLEFLHIDALEDADKAQLFLIRDMKYTCRSILPGP
jgi:hypothetical protein